MMRIKDFIDYEQPNKYIVDSDQYNNEYDLPVLTAGQSFILGYTNEINGIYEKYPCIIFDDFTTSVHYVDFPFKVKSSAMKILKNKGTADLKYCYYLLLSMSNMPENHKRQWISTTSEKNHELPSIDNQRKISSVLDKVSMTINQYKLVLNELDTLIKARFVELFGGIDRTQYVTINDICSIITDGTHQPPKFVQEGIPFIFVSNLANDEVTYNAEKFITEDTYSELIKRTPIEIGDVLLSTVGSYGHTAVVKSDKKFLFQRHIAYLKPKHELIDSEYLRGAFLSADGQRQIEEKAKGIAQKTLNLSEIRSIEIPLPSMDQQNQFVTFVTQVDKSKYVAPHK